MIYLIFAVYLSGLFIIAFLLIEMFTGRELKAFYKKVKRRHLVKEVNPGDEMF